MGRRSIPFIKMAKLVQQQKRQFKSARHPSHPDPTIFQPGNEKQAIHFMAYWKIEPHWGFDPGTGASGLMFRSIPASGGLFHIRHSVDDIALYSQGLGLLVDDEYELHERIATVQEAIRRKAGLENAPFATRHHRRQAT